MSQKAPRVDVREEGRPREDKKRYNDEADEIERKYTRRPHCGSSVIRDNRADGSAPARSRFERVFWDRICMRVCIIGTGKMFGDYWYLREIRLVMREFFKKNLCGEWGNRLFRG